MPFTEKISLLFDVESSKGVKSLKDLRTSVHDADGAMGKMKAGASGLSGVMAANLGPSLIAAGTAVAAFALKSAAAFTGLAKSSIDLGAATGLSTEESSKWIAVADDMGVSAGDLTVSLGKIAKTLDSGKWEAYGIATHTAGGQARDTNDILLDSFDKLGKITNETERAKVGNELFGKGYAQLAPLIGKTREEYEGMLGAVSDGQTITKEEAERAEKLRLAQDKLKDALQDVMLMVGELVAAWAPMIEALAAAVEWTSGLQLKMQDLGTTLLGVDTTAMAIGADFVVLNNRTKDVSGSTKRLETDVYGVRMELAEADAAVRGLDKAYSDLHTAIDDEQAWLDLQDAIDGQNQKMLDSTATDREKQQSTLDTKEELLDYLATIEKVPAEKQTEIIALINEGDWNAANAALGELTKDRNILLFPKVVTSSGGPNPGALIPVVGSFDSGGVVPGPRGSRQLVEAHGGETVLPTHKNGAVGGDTHFHMEGAIISSTIDFERMVNTALLKSRQRGSRV